MKGSPSTRHGRRTLGRSLLVARLLLAPVVLLTVVGSSPAHADDVHRTVERIHTRGRYPNDLLVAPRGEGAGRPGRGPVPIFGGRSAPELSPDPAAPWDLPDWNLPFLHGLSLLGYVALALCILALAAFLVWLLARLRRLPVESTEPARRSRNDESAEPLDPLLAIPTLSHAELAAQGRFREAVHALLIEALLSTGWVPEGRGRGLTAREIVHRYDQRTPPRDPLVELLGMVERVWFGGREATLETYESALRLHGRLVTSPTVVRRAAEAG